MQRSAIPAKFLHPLPAPHASSRGTGSLGRDDTALQSAVRDLQFAIRNPQSEDHSLDTGH
jgi:hypothetical protein